MILSKEEYKALVASFRSGIHYYEVPTASEFKRKIYGDDYSFWQWFQGQNQYGGNGDVVFEDLHIELGRVPTYHEFTERMIEGIKVNDWSKQNNIKWTPMKEEIVKLRVGWYYKSHMLEVFTLTQLHHKFPDCHVWSDSVIDRVFGVDIVFEDKKTGTNFYFHITQDGNNIMSKQNRGYCKDADGKWHKFKRDFSLNKGHMTLHYSRYTDYSTGLMGSQPIFRPVFLEDKVEEMRKLKKNHDFDDSVAPKELSRFQKFVDENNIV